MILRISEWSTAWESHCFNRVPLPHNQLENFLVIKVALKDHHIGPLYADNGALIWNQLTN